ncbi:MAG: FAD-dependent oxidoreductase [Pseudomonadota bacterium]
MTQSVAVVGAGIAGMCTALALSRQNFEVTLIERDVPPPDGDADAAFFAWQRRGAAQFRHPHAFLGLMCSLLEERYPDLLEEFFAHGARKVTFADMVPPHLATDFTPEPIDEQMWMLLCRRATMETVLRRYVARQNNIKILNTAYITNLEIDHSGSTPRMVALELTDRGVNNTRSRFCADLFVDATGRASKFPSWLGTHNILPDEQRDDAEIVYYTRHYQLLPGVDEPSRHDNDPAAGDLGYMKYGVFPGENGHFALIICLPNGEGALRDAVKDGAQFDQICCTIPGLVPWISAEKATATTEPFGIGDIQAVWRNYVQDDRALLHNFFSVGDSSVRTNPLYGRGCSTGILHAHILADVLAEESDPETRALRYQALTDERLRPIFDASLNEDKNGIKRAEAVMRGEERDRADSFKKWLRLSFGDALAAAARDELHVFRGMMKTVNLVEKPGDFLQDPKVKRTIFRYMLRGRKRNGKARVQRGLGRQEMLQFLDEIGAST